jgi:hypothetical protein
MLIVNVKVPSVQRIKFKGVLYLCKKYVKCALVQPLMLCTGHTAHMGSRDIAPIFLDYGTKRG